MTITPLGLPAPPPPVGGTRPESKNLIDRFGRTATDLRVSLTDRCNLRCTYCMPAEGMSWLPSEELLTPGEFERLISVAVTHLGIRSIRFTGGEPLLHPHLPRLIRYAASLAPRPEIALTTNALGLHHRIEALKSFGLDRINISLDTIDRETFAALTRRDRLHDVLRGLDAAVASDVKPIKINAVLMRGVNDQQAIDLLRYCMVHDYQLRFIEQMPLDGAGDWKHSAMITADEILTILRASFGLTPDETPRGAAPAQLWRVDDTRHRVGIIAAVSKPFCGDCDRVRLTADGAMRTCLFSHDETDMRSMVRDSSCSDLDIAEVWRTVLWDKKAGHGISDAEFTPPARAMSAIGG